MNTEDKAQFPAFENRDVYVDLGEHISFYRKRIHITQAELARRVNISRSYMSRIESSNTSQSFSLELLFNISRELGVEPRVFFDPLPTDKESR